MSEKMDEERDLGEMGESHLVRLCASKNYVASKDPRDLNGWDFLIQERTLRSFDTEAIHESPFEVKAQVKSTTSDKSYVPVKLSAALSLCRSPIPSFFIVFIYSKGDEPVASYAVHVDEDFIAKTMEKAYAEQAKKKPRKLNDIYINVKFRKEDKFIDSGQFISILRKAIGDKPSFYIQEKQKWIKSAGIEEHPFVMNINFTIDNVIKLQRSYLGYDEEIEVDCISSYMKRFGHIIPQSIPPTGKAVMKVSKESLSKEAFLHLSNDSFDSEVTVSCALYGVPSNLLTSDFPYFFRIETPLFDILLKSDNKGMDINFSSSEKSLIPFYTLYKGAKALICISDEYGCEIKLSAGERMMPLGKVSIDHKVSNDIRLNAEPLFQLKKILDTSNQIENIKFFPNEILDHAEEIGRIYQVGINGMKLNKIDMIYDVDESGETVPDNLRGKSASMPVIEMLSFSNLTVLVSLHHNYMIELCGQEISLLHTGTRIFKVLVSESPEEAKIEKEKLLEEALLEIKESGIIHIELKEVAN